MTTAASGAHRRGPDRFRTLSRAAMVLVLLVVTFVAMGTERDYYFARALADNTLAQNTVTALAQDEDGFLWIGTQGGLHRYDGQHFTIYRHQPGIDDSLADSFVTALATDQDHGLWIGGYSQSLARLDLRTGRLRRYALADPADGRTERPVQALLPGDGGVWVGTTGGLERLDPVTGTHRPVLALPARALGAQPQALLRDPDGTVWYGTALGLYRLPVHGQAHLVSPGVVVARLLRDRGGRLWAGGPDGLFLLQDAGRPGLVRAWPKRDDDPAQNAAHAIVDLAQAPDGNLWFSVAGQGLRRFNPGTGGTLALRQDDSLPGMLSEDGINALLVDAAGLLWVGGQLHGLEVADTRGARFTYLADMHVAASGAHRVDNSVRSIWEDRNQRMWVGTDGGRLLRYSQDSGFEDLSNLLPDASDRRVMAFADPGDGRPWVATMAGLFRLDPDIPSLLPVAPPALHSPLRSLATSDDGSIWLGTGDAGLVQYQPGSAQVRHVAYGNGQPDVLSHAQVHAVLDARDGRVWIGTGHGLDVLDPSRNQLRHYEQQADRDDALAGDLVRALWQAPDGAIWVGSHGGLNRVARDANGKDRFSRPLSAALGMQEPPVVFSITGDEHGDVWLGTDRGLLRFTPRTGRLRGYGLVDGLQSAEFNGGAVATLHDGRLAFGGVNGINVFDPARVVQSEYQPPLRLLDVRIGAQRDDDTRPAWHVDAIDLPESSGLLRLRVGALDYLGRGTIRYRYRIDGIDHDWIDNGTRSDITYTLLPAGHYMLRVQGTNHDAVWNPNELRIPVNVTPPLWRHPLALAAYALLLLALLGGAWSSWRRRRRRERSYFSQIRDREERLKLALWASGEQFWDYDLTRGELQSMRVQEDSGEAANAGVQTEIRTDQRIHRDDMPQVEERLRQHLRGATALFLSEHRVDDDQGGWIWMRARGRVVERDGNGRAMRIAGTARNITHSRHAERERRIASEVLRSMNEAVSVLDRNFDFISINPAFARMTGYGDVEVIGRNASLLDSAQHDTGFYAEVREQLRRQGRWSGEMWQQRKDGEEFLCAYECSAVLDGNGQHSLYVVVLSDITDQKRAEQELRYLANYDTLTNLPNRTLLAERLSRAIVRARRQDDYIAVLFLDLDRFKDINDSLGHAAGDRILRATAARLQDTVGAQHTVARLGGDEFTVVLEHLETPEQADKVAREILTAFEAPLLLDDRQEVAISPSIGISLYPMHAQVPTELLKQADTAMYQAKAAGRRTYMRYTETMDVAIRQRATISGALRKVLDRGELRLAYQPRLALAQGRIVGTEALLRWHSEEHGDIPPTDFIPLAEESGLILEIGEWVLREACLTLQRWRQHGLDELVMSVNVSALQLLRGDLPSVVERVLAETGLPAQALELELTESVIMANAQQTADKLQAFRDMGVSLAIDDFGTGYSSLAYLKRLPITTLKIDKEFVDDLSQGSEDAAITTTVIAMARSLGLNVVAEGVETAAQMAFLRAQQCDEIQGFWLSPPLDSHRCLAFIRGWSSETMYAGAAESAALPDLSP